MMLSLTKLVAFVAILFAVSSPSSAFEDDSGFLGNVRSKYEALNSKQRFWAGAAAGFVGSRLALSSAVTAVKVAGVAFVTTEVLHHTGVLDDLPSLSDEQSNMITVLKGRTLKQVNLFRVQVRKTLNPKSMQAFMETEKTCSFGLAGGAVLGFML